MAEPFKQKNLTFSEFDKPSFKDWQQKIREDLKGEDYTERFAWDTNEGITVLPIYDNNEPGNSLAGLTRGDDWKICQLITSPNCEKANDAALKALMNGAAAVCFDLPAGAIRSSKDVRALLSGIILDIVPIHFGASISLPAHLECVQTYIKEQNLRKNQYDFKFNSDGFTAALQTGRLLPMDEFDAGGNFNSLSVNADFYADAGAAITDQLAFAVAAGNEYLGLADNPESLAPRIHFNFGAGPLYFLEIAKFRAFRLLWAQVLDGYKAGLSEKLPAYIHAHSARLNTSVKDPHNNILRATTAAMSAVLGGADTVTIIPFDALYDEENYFSNRITRNIQHILKEEAYFGKVNDPAAGSYYIEHLTTALAEEAWKTFQKIEKQGGFHACIRKGSIQQRIKTAQTTRINAAKDGSLTILGVNKYPPKTEEIRKAKPLPKFTLPQAKTSILVETVSEIRPAEYFEEEGGK